MTDELPEEVQRWTAKRRTALIVSIIRGETSVHEATRKHGLTVAEVEDWREKFLLAAENALRTKPRDEEAQKDEQIKKLKQKVGDSSSTSTSSRRPRRDALSPRRRQTSESGVPSRFGTPGLPSPRGAALSDER